MSKKHRRPRPRSPTVSSNPSPSPRTHASDGYANPAAFLGESSALLSSGTYARSFDTQNYELLTAVYRENWIAKKIIDMPSEDMTRAWYTLSTNQPQSRLDALRRLEARHSVRQELTNAIRWARLYGGSLALMVIQGEEDRLAEPLDPDLLLPDCFQGLLVIDRSMGIEPSMELESDLDDPDFGLPKFYTVTLLDGAAVTIHHSRLLRFIGRELPQRETERENYWGASELEHIWEELQKRNATSANIAQLVFQANITTLKMSDYGEMLALGTERQQERVLNAIETQNRMRTSFGLQVMSADDSLENHPYSFSGLSEVYETFMMDMAGASEIPATRLFGRSPQGMNATGEADLKTYYELIAQMQERQLRPALEKLLPVMTISAWGEIPDDLEILFDPLMTSTAEERASIISQLTGAVLNAYQAGLIDRRAAIEELIQEGKDIGIWTKLEVPVEESLQRALPP